MTAQHFLVPLDFSAYSDQALDYAIGLATKLQARLTLLHVIHLAPLGIGEMGAVPPAAYLEDLETEARHGLENCLKRVQDAGLQGDSVLVHGVPFQSIVDTAHDKKVDLIVMGTHGRTGLYHVLLGSVAEKVVRLAPCPVLIARGVSGATVQ
ncbi:MAG TPA: universal stress protein [Candidatus Tectomicrobia bacterium]|jgi:nucleotide-binding universal stress UspA family protein